MAEEQSTGKNFFATIPGIITGIAGLITAIGGFLLVLNKTGCMSANKEVAEQHITSTNTEENKTTQDSSFQASKVSYSPIEVKHLTQYITYKIEKADVETFPNKEIVLNVKLKCVNDSRSEYHFYSRFIRVVIDGDKYAPDPNSPSKDYVSIPDNSFKRLEYNYKLPADTKHFNLVFYDEKTEIGSSAFTLNQ